MKKVLAVILTIAMLFGASSLSVNADDLIVEISGIKTKNTAIFKVDAKNVNNSETKLNVYLATYANGILESAESYTEILDPLEEAMFRYEAQTEGKSAKLFVWEKGIRPIVPSLTSGNCAEVGEEVKIPYTSLDAFASFVPEEHNPAGNVCDGDLSTVWTVSGASAENSENVTIYLGDYYILSRLKVAFGLGRDREYIYSVSSSEDGENFVDLTESITSKKTDGLQEISFAPVRAKYIRLNTHGRTDGGSWVQVSEIETYGYSDTTGSILMENVKNWNILPMSEMTYTDYTPSLGEELYAEETDAELYLYDNVDRSGDNAGEELAILSVKASQVPEANNAPANVLDNNLSTIWTASGITDEKPAYMICDMGEGYYLTEVGIGFDKGSERVYTFDASVSEDGVSYTKVLSRRESEKSNEIQYFAVNPCYGRYVKYTFYKRADSGDNGWLRVSELRASGRSTQPSGAGGILAQKSLVLPPDRGDYEIEFDLNIEGNPYYSGVSLTNADVNGGADLDTVTALQLRFDNFQSGYTIKYIKSNYFNEGSPVELFENSFAKGENVHFKMYISPSDRSVAVTAEQNGIKETRNLYFSHGDEELTRNTRWSGWEANTIVFNTGAGAKGSMTISSFTLRDANEENKPLMGTEPCYGVVRLEAVRRDDYPTSSGDYYGRYVHYNGKDAVLSVAADKNPSVTRFVEHRGLLGCGVSLEAEDMPGYYIVCEQDAFCLKKLQNNGDFYARATFFKEEAENVGYYGGSTYSYRTYLERDNEAKYLYDTTTDKKKGDLKPWKMWDTAQGTFYVKNESAEYVADNFYGSSIASKWWTNYPWKSNNPTNDSYNHSGLITKNNVIVKDGELLLKATKIASNAWPKDKNGETGITYGKWNKGYEKWKAYVGVVSIQNKVYNRNCFIEGSFKQPESPVGYWNAFWLTGRDFWPPEIDIFETLSSNYGSKAWHTAIHGQNDQNNLFGKSSKDNIDVTTGYHTFSMDWGYDYIKFYVDGKLFQRTHNNSTLNFQKNMRLILNTGIGGWEAEPDDTTLWDDGLRCRFVRTFQY